MSPFNIQRIKQGEVQIVSVSGYLGNDECHRLEKELGHLLKNQNQHVVLNCSALTFATVVSLARLFVLAGFFHRRNGNFRLAGLSDRFARIAHNVGFDQQMDIYPDVTAALNCHIDTTKIGNQQPSAQKELSRARDKF
jgi:anti-anti-sigma factor